MRASWIILLLCLSTGKISSVRASSGKAFELDAAISWLSNSASNLVHGCQVRLENGWVIYTPDGMGNYRALWTRDFAYMLENGGDLIPLADARSCIEILLRGQRADGAIPDRVQPDGVAVYSGGPINQPLGEPNLDNSQFMIIAADIYLRRLSRTNANGVFKKWRKQLVQALDYVPLSASGLVFNDPAKPHSPYGFTDTIGKTGELTMESLLYWTAARRLAFWLDRTGHRAEARNLARRAQQIESSAGTLWDSHAGAFFAASQDCHQIDIWATAYAWHLKFLATNRRNQASGFLTENYGDYVWHGQVRHLLRDEYWERLLAPVQKDRYQNGAYWATASGWVMEAVAEKNPSLAREMFKDLIQDFQAQGICECVQTDYRQLPSYLVSAVNPLGAARKLFRKPSPGKHY
jgi:hypothetical protein